MPPRRITRQVAVTALREAAVRTQVQPAELTVPAYRTFRGQAVHAERPPSELTISLLFGGWHRACDEAARRPWRADVEGEVRAHLYGGRARR